MRLKSELGHIVDAYRGVVFGSVVNAEGSATVKTGGSVLLPRVGILETKRRLTSELIGPLTESYRALRCRSLAVCQVIQASAQRSEVAPVDIQVLGCVFERPTRERLYPECLFSGPTGQPEQNVLFSPASVTDECRRLVEQTLAFERAVLKLAVAYDAGYRSLLQQAGMVDAMLQVIPTYAVQPLRRMVGLLGKLSQIPCFLAQCDLPARTDPFGQPDSGLAGTGGPAPPSPPSSPPPSP